MTVKLHLFKGYQNKKRGISPETEVGYLYSDTGDREELLRAGRQLGLNDAWLQNKATGIPRFDIWRTPLIRAKNMFRTVTDEEFAADVEKLNKEGNDATWLSEG
jgi:hypothetical protein